ncbi:Crp/Fnr family transcriptional regulator [Altericroceibacterium spongiae]|uniref:Crp/Fnr family transcriptional regulator n=1 Tax=Altericroceibacterium spongiae TaxID=2320269 RepID=UPI0016004906|nr:Crp/Fnr family transcriptional regulator [Altericroceibacterium spongiae]
MHRRENDYQLVDPVKEHKIICEKISNRFSLSNKSKYAFESLNVDLIFFRANKNLSTRKELNRKCLIIIDGLISKFRLSRDGKRHITSFYFPNEFVNLSSLFSDSGEYELHTHTNCIALSFQTSELATLAKSCPEWAHILWQEFAQEFAIAQEWLINLGQRTGVEQIGNLLLEIAIRSKAITDARNVEFRLPLTQIDLADTVGLSPVHTNRSLKILKSMSMLEISGRRVFIEDIHKLSNYVGFDPNYLDLNHKTLNNNIFLCRNF